MSLQKRKYIVSQAIRNSAKGQECTLRSPLCNQNPETVVACHVNEYETGKGKGIKGDDIHVFFGCSACHSFYDNNIMDRNMVRSMVLTALIRTQRILYDMGILKVEL